MSDPKLVHRMILLNKQNKNKISNLDENTKVEVIEVDTSKVDLPKGKKILSKIVEVPASAAYLNPAPEVPAPEVPAPEVPAPEVPAPEVPTPEVPAPEVPAPEVPAPEVPAPEVPAPEVPAPEVPAPEVPAPEVSAEVTV
jgi:hypothetical protein